MVGKRVRRSRTRRLTAFSKRTEQGCRELRVMAAGPMSCSHGEVLMGLQEDKGRSAPLLSTCPAPGAGLSICCGCYIISFKPHTGP